MTKATRIEHLMDYAFYLCYEQSWPGWMEVGVRETLQSKNRKWLNEATKRKMENLIVQVKKYW